MKVKVISLPYIFQVLYVLCFTGPRYQVSVYRTIGPLVQAVSAISMLYCGASGKSFLHTLLLRIAPYKMADTFTVALSLSLK